MLSVHYAFEHPPDKAPFRKILVAWFTRHQESARTVTENTLDVNDPFCLELVLSMISRQDRARDILSAPPQSQDKREEH